MSKPEFTDDEMAAKIRTAVRTVNDLVAVGQRQGLRAEIDCAPVRTMASEGSTFLTVTISKLIR